MPFAYFTQNQFIPLLISVAILILSVFSYSAKKNRTDLVLLFLGSAGFGFFMANLDHFLILWDEQFHALVAKNLIANPLKPVLIKDPILGFNYKNWSGNYIWLHKQPLFLWQIALSLKLFGFNALAVRLPSVILHSIAVLMIYRIGKITHSENTGFFGALFFAVAFYPLELVAGRFTTDHNDLSFLFYVLASFWAWFEYQQSQKKYFLILIGLFAGCAVLVKWLPGLLIFAVWFFSLGADNKRNWIRPKSYIPLITSFSVSLFIFLPWQIFIIMKYPLESAYEFSFNTRHFFEPLENHGGNIWFHYHAFKDIYGSGDAIPFIYLAGIIVLLIKTKSNAYRIAIAAAITITYTFYTLAATKMTSFCVIVSPFAFLGIGALTDFLLSILRKKIRFSKFELIFQPILLLIICFYLLNLSKIQNHHTDWKPNDNHNRIAEIKEMDFIDKLKTELGNDKYVVFNARVRIFGHIPVMFYTDYLAFDIIPTLEQLKRAKAAGYKIAIYDNDSLPGYVKQSTDIVKIKL